VPAPPHVSLPKDAQLVELRADVLTVATRNCLLPGTQVSFDLVMEGRPLRLQAPVRECLVVAKVRSGYVFHPRLWLGELAQPDRHLIALFIGKGRGSPAVAPAPVPR
jgi:hypothetical protein